MNNRFSLAIVLMAICISASFASIDSIDVMLDVNCDGRIDSIKFYENENETLWKINGEKTSYRSYFKNGEFISVHEIPMVSKSCPELDFFVQYISHHLPITDVVDLGLAYILKPYKTQNSDRGDLVVLNYIDFENYCTFLNQNKYDFKAYFEDYVLLRSKYQPNSSGMALVCYAGKNHLNPQFGVPLNESDSLLNYRYVVPKFEGKIQDFAFYSTKHGVFYLKNETYEWVYITRGINKFRIPSITKVEIVNEILRISVTTALKDTVIMFKVPHPTVQLQKRKTN